MKDGGMEEKDVEMEGVLDDWRRDWEGKQRRDFEGGHDGDGKLEGGNREER